MHSRTHERLMLATMWLAPVVCIAIVIVQFEDVATIVCVGPVTLGTIAYAWMVGYGAFYLGVYVLALCGQYPETKDDHTDKET